ncbi:FKBP-type peptidyl-prolyl cis-trans isomerase [Demequina sp.]|uniref:FKBP-type peptidyl-prolyl cis-trans isomerase n=1 Tax=Demequina sp. TaxID=2050685 RepID=UPI0025DF0290|nr:FKBP-type peptidyl-prolyl cis-trans isomerase [Demequina sp.]
MKKNVLTATVLGTLAVLALTACSASSGSEPSASPSATTGTVMSAADLAALETIEWTETDDVPTLTFESPFTVTGIATRVIADGDGATIEDGQNVSLQYVVYNGTDASVIFSTWETDTPEVVNLTSGQVVQDLYDALVGNKVGTDLLYVYPDTSTEDGSAVIMAVTVVDAVTPLGRAEGTAVDPIDGLPSITLDDSGKPAIDFSTAGDVPTDLVVQPLIEGDGAAIAVDDQVTVHYTGWLWDGEQFDSSWDRGVPANFPLSTGSLIDGWVQGLDGQTVGSQVMLVVPPELAYGDVDQDTIPANSTLVFVIDILSAS